MADHQRDHGVVVDFCPSQFAGVLAVAQDGDAVGEGGDFAETVRDIDDGDAAAPQVVYDGEERFGLFIGQTGSRLVHDQDAGLSREGLGDLD